MNKIIDNNIHKNIKILTISGGGIKGLIPFTILKYIQDNLNYDIINNIDFYSGSSIGAIIIMLLLHPDNKKLNNYDISKYLYNFAYRSSYHIIKTLDGLFGSKYETTKIHKDIDDIFKNIKLSDIKKDFMIPIYDINSNIVINITKESHPNMLVSDLLKGCTAAPTLYDPYNLDYIDNDILKKYKFIDSGVVNNMPIDDILDFVLYDKNINKNNIKLLSFDLLYYLQCYNLTNYGLIKWSNNLSYTFMNARREESINYCKKKLNDNYTNIYIEMPDEVVYYTITTDDSIIQKLINITLDNLNNNTNNIIDKINNFLS